MTNRRTFVIDADVDRYLIQRLQKAQLASNDKPVNLSRVLNDVIREAKRK